MRRSATLALLVLLVFAGFAPGGDGDEGKGKRKKEKGEKGAGVAVTGGFSNEQRRSVEGWFAETHGRGKCPPGLAKKNNGCLPPGQAKKRYAVGKPLPPGVETRPPAAEILVRIGRPPDGYTYVVVDGDLLKLAVGTMLVVDAIDGLVN